MTQARRYSRLMIALHWATAALVLIAYFLSEGGPDIRTNPPTWHFIIGMGVLLLVLPRLLIRIRRGAPAPAPSIGRRLAQAARLGHLTLYLLLIAVPLTGWYTMSRLGVTLTVLGISLPSLTTAVVGFPGLIAIVHQWGGNGILIVAGLHAAFALWHHFVRRDDTLRRMSPY